ncbi:MULTISPECIES: Hsp20/alpha crystallin family protein [Roseateles]|uniref:Hsp20/alpha crystallin family protein n=1 Tax=Pelomonas caseinilytica TaxID=2906763 RepID=A0ABS8XPU1_9BURK|nr:MULTISPECIES: Hsp20/alpha crystallin family protein [unclassified Roseateles]MCE4539235.1 Hsp20/alpha crystallin family protein [Pelomonas sp. P7]HEV6964934.1 Hsp20/alpha crystallin family protein [Roseateles sp.]
MSTTAVQTDAGHDRTPARQGAEADSDRALMPRVDVSEDDTGITLTADLPGVAREQLELQVEGDTLRIEGRVDAAAPTGLEPVYAEVRLPRYRRSFTLSRELDASRIEAQLKDGVLRLRIPKQAHAQPRRIEVS